MRNFYIYMLVSARICSLRIKLLVFTPDLHIFFTFYVNVLTREKLSNKFQRVWISNAEQVVTWMISRADWKNRAIGVALRRTAL